MHKLLTALFFSLFFVIGAGAQKAEAQSANLCFTNGSSFIIYMRAFSASRNAVWPAGGNWVLNDRAERCALLSCIPGEQICYGGTNNSGTYWGVGYDGNMGCQACCGTCDGGTYRANLVD